LQLFHRWPDAEKTHKSGFVEVSQIRERFHKSQTRLDVICYYYRIIQHRFEQCGCFIAPATNQQPMEDFCQKLTKERQAYLRLKAKKLVKRLEAERKTVFTQTSRETDDSGPKETKLQKKVDDMRVEPEQHFKKNSEDENPFEIQEGVSIISRTGTYHVDKILKRRNFGELVQCTHLETGEIFALKCIRKKFEDSYKQEEEVLQYISSLNCDENNLVKFREVFHYRDRIFIAFEKLDMTLKDFMRERNWKPFSIDEIRIIADQMLLALNSLKQAGLTHTNVTPENIMLVDHESQPLRVKLIGFGKACLTSELSERNIAVNCGYSAPEIVLDGSLDNSVDTWGLGCTLAFLSLGFHLYPICDEYEYLRVIVQLFGNPDEMSLDFLIILPAEALHHTFFRSKLTQSSQSPRESWHMAAHTDSGFFLLKRTFPLHSRWVSLDKKNLPN
uniref:Protein kinase domain-containing protein n=1 Tax=Nothobranchius furzeri TaxID=105023 RepID=A0A8C6LA47_NOTFU